MRKYIIDYRNGASGNTILSHILYACGKLNTTNIFNKTSNTHSIQKLNKTELIANHQKEQFLDGNTIIEVVTHKLDELLRIKMSYEKWHEDYPRHDNYKIFFDSKFVVDDEKEWKDFYNNYKDISWPECPLYKDKGCLPKRILDEIDEVFVLPVKEVNKDNFIEFMEETYLEYLTVNLENNISKFGGTLYNLEDYYFEKNVDVLESVITSKLKWVWNKDKSKEFHKLSIEQNSKYLDWLRKIEDSLNSDKNNKLLDWEIALVNAFKEFKEIGANNGKTI